MKKRTTMILALLLAAATLPRADAEPRSKGRGYTEAAIPRSGDRTAYATTDTAAPLTWDSNGATAGGLLNVCVPFGEMVAIKAKGGEWVGTFTMDDDVTMPLDVDAAGACYVADPDVAAASGRGACITVADGERHYVAVDFVSVYSSPGARATVCSSPITALNGKTVWPPCSTTADCTSLGAGTCVTGTNRTEAFLRDNSCALVTGQVDTNPTYVSITVAG